ncbi:LuxR C-terminal-related transcriptional regulator [Microvirga sp. G4-2]|uniref:LuxR C-terminal-related transcriptional regulator n=1 Tax=Microvirga sp. G4-2 TaxID=3434467 RepID=UPI004043BB32
MLFDRAYQEQKLVMNAAGPCVTRVHVYATPLFRTGVEQILDGTRFVVADSVFQSDSQSSAADDTAAELFIVDENYRPRGILDLIAELKAQNAAARVIVLADQFDINAVVSARHAGADGFCLITSSRDVLVRSIELVMLGEIVVPSELVLAIIEGSVPSTDCSLGLNPEKLIGIAPRIPLSSRETEVLSLLKEGAPNKVIARKLDVAETTVKVHVKAILRKIGVHNRSQAAIWAAYHLPLDVNE